MVGEAQIARRQRHANVMPLLASFLAGPELWLVLPLCRCTLRGLLDGAFPQARTCPRSPCLSKLSLKAAVPAACPCCIRRVFSHLHFSLAWCDFMLVTELWACNRTSPWHHAKSHHCDLL